MHVRKARPGDAAAIQALYKELVPGDANIAVDPRRIVELDDDAYNHLFVVEAPGGVCGTAFLTLCLDPMYGFQPYGVVENVIIADAARRNGAGRMLLAAVEHLARSAHCTKLMLLSTATRREAHAFFMAIGFDGDRKRGFVKYINRSNRPGPPSAT